MNLFLAFGNCRGSCNWSNIDFHSCLEYSYYCRKKNFNHWTDATLKYWIVWLNFRGQLVSGLFSNLRSYGTATTLPTLFFSSSTITIYISHKRNIPSPHIAAISITFIFPSATIPQLQFILVRDLFHLSVLSCIDQCRAISKCSSINTYILS